LSGGLDWKHRLVSSQGILRADGQRLSRYRFRHILFQRYLYNSLDRVSRPRLHEAVGTALEGLHGDQIDEVSVELARHFQEAGNVAKAIDYLARAGQRALRVSANDEAIVHCRQALALLETLPESPERAGQELMLQAGLGIALQVTRGYGDTDAGQACARARELCAQAGDTPQLPAILWMLESFYNTRGDLQAARELAEQLRDLVDRIGDPALAPMARFAVAWNQMPRGELVRARANFEQAIALCDAQPDHGVPLPGGVGIGTTGRTFLSWALWTLGYADQALSRIREAQALAQRSSSPFCLAVTQCHTAMFHVSAEDKELALKLGEACIRLSSERGFSYWLAVGMLCHGWALAQHGQTEEGIAQLRKAIADFQATGHDQGHPHRLAYMAQAYGRAGRAEEGLPLLDEALAMARRNSERYYEAEIHRLRGELLLLQGMEEAEAEASFTEGIEVARRLSARMWELRATVSLCRLWQRQGKRRKARRRPICRRLRRCSRSWRD
jgi:tetratricopeptide (TPR) repeat protein